MGGDLFSRAPPPTPDPSPPFAARMGGGERTEQAARLSSTAKGASARKLISTGREVRREGGLHTLYISPLKALAVDIARNLETPVAEMKLPIRIETRTGDTPASKRQRQRRDPPHILLDDAGAACADPGVARRAVPVRLAAPRRARRAARAGDVEARRSALARAGAAVRAGAGPDDGRPVGDGRRARRPAPLPAAANRRARPCSPIS